MTRTAKQPFPFSTTVGRRIRNRKEELGLSDNKFAKLAGVSRRHLMELQKGSNASIMVLLKAMEALDLEELPLTGAGGERVTVSPVRIGAADLQESAKALETGARLILGVAAMLRAAATRSAPTPREPKVREALSAKGARLIEEFGDYVRNLDPEEQVDALKQVFDGRRADLAHVAPRQRKRRPTG